MTTNEQTWTVNSIQAAMRARGSHWWDPDTMRCFGTRPLPTVYQGPGGVYFVTGDKDYDGRRGYTVRRFNPETAEIDTVGDVAGFTREGAIRRAKEHAIKAPGTGLLVAPEDGGLPCAARGLKETTEAFRPVTVLEQFVADLRAHGDPKANGDEARELMNLARRHHKQAEEACNGERDEINPVLEDRIRKEAARVGASGVVFSGDPRGCTVKLTFADGATNDFGRKGWVVPTGEGD